MSMSTWIRLAGAAAAAMLPTCATAQTFPSKPLRLIVSSTPASGVDILARLVGPKLTEAFGQQVVIDNRPGAGGNLGATLAARAAPDGHALFLATPAHAIASSVPGNAGYDLLRDFAPISLLTTGQYMLVVHPSVPVKTVKELIALARARPGQLNYASAGNANATHLAGELFNLMANVRTVHIPYKGAGPAQIELVGGQVDFMIHNISAVLGDSKTGKLRALAVTGLKRSDVVPDVPTLHEAGLTGYEITSWFGVVAPAGTPQDVVGVLNRAFVRAMTAPDLRQKLAALGAEAVGSAPRDLAAHLKAEQQKWAQVIRKSGIRIE